MSQAAILLWLPAMATAHAGGPVGEMPTSEPPTAATPTQAQRALLNRWAERRLLRLEAPHSEPTSTYPDYSHERVRRIEDLLEQARTLSGSLDEERAQAQLREVESLVYAHPELPQAAFLLAEAAAQQADLAERAGQAKLAQIQRTRARVLEGPRAGTYTQKPPSESDDELSPARLIRIKGLAPSDVLEWNGRRQPSQSAMVTPGEHHARVFRMGQLVFAQFVMVPLDGETIRLPVPHPKPCSHSDLATVSAQGQQVTGHDHVQCARWIAARPAEAAGIEVALCEQNRCGKLLSWQPGDGKVLTPPLHPEPGWRWPVWATYLGLGVGIAATTGAVLWQSGAFDDPERGPVTWTFGGVED